MPTSLLTVDPDISSTITGGFTALTTILLVVIGAAFTLAGLVIAARAGIKWLRSVGQK